MRGGAWSEMSDEARLQHLLSRTNVNASGCLEYTGSIQSNGYSRATVCRKNDYGHRHTYRLSRGAIPAGLDVCHSCDNRKRINPDHLFLGTRGDNMADAVAKGRQARGAMLPHAKLTSLLSAEIVSLAKQGHQYKEIAARFGICRQHAGQVAIKHGVRRNGISQ